MNESELRARRFGRALRSILGKPVSCQDPLVMLTVMAIVDAMAANPAQWLAAMKHEPCDR